MPTTRTEPQPQEDAWVSGKRRQSSQAASNTDAVQLMRPGWRVGDGGMTRYEASAVTAIKMAGIQNSAR